MININKRINYAYNNEATEAEKTSDRYKTVASEKIGGYMFAIIFIVIALFSYKKTGIFIAMLCAAIVDIVSIIAYQTTVEFELLYAYYAVLFLITFAWWLTMCKLRLIASEIVSGIATVFMTIAVLDCYFSSGYETFISLSFQYIVLSINLLTILAAWYDRDWSYNANCSGRVKGDNPHIEGNL